MTGAPTAERLAGDVAAITEWALARMQAVMAEVHASGAIADGRTAALVSSLAQLHQDAVRIAGVLEMKDAG